MAESWQPAREPQALPLNEVHVWRLALDQPEAIWQRLERVLTPDEVARADRFYFARDRRRFVVSRAAVRLLLAHYLALPSGAIEFYTGPYGKPYTSPKLEATPLQFNVSHSEEMALLGFVRQRQLGIDIEFRKPLAEIGEIAVNFFSPHEVATLLGLPAPLQPLGFFNCWSRKEAYIKAIGKGLSQPLDSFDVTLRPGEPARLLRVAGQPDEPARWQMQILEPHPGYAAALALEGNGWQLRCFDYTLTP